MADVIFDTQLSGDALNSVGFEAFNTIEGLGLNTQGFLWPLEGIWGPAADEVTSATIWVQSTDSVGNGLEF